MRGLGGRIHPPPPAWSVDNTTAELMALALARHVSVGIVPAAQTRAYPRKYRLVPQTRRLAHPAPPLSVGSQRPTPSEGPPPPRPTPVLRPRSTPRS